MTHRFPNRRRLLDLEYLDARIVPAIGAIPAAPGAAYLAATANAAETPILDGINAQIAVTAGMRTFQQTNLLADQAGQAPQVDPNLINPWDIAIAPGGNFWIADNGTDVSTVYSGDVSGSALTINPLTVSIPGGAPTGIVFNSTSDFVVSDGTTSGKAVFLFATENGQIAGWNPNVPASSKAAQTGVTVTGAVFKGITIGSNSSGNFVYAADFANGRIDVFDKSFTAATLTGNFTDPNMQKGFAPFNIQDLNGTLYVTYAKQEAGSTDEAHGQGLGFVDAFDTDGQFLRRIGTRGVLNAPWGMAIAPASFGAFANDLLVGNFGDGRIHAFDPTTGHYRGTLRDAHGQQIRIDGLWGLAFGNGTTAGDAGTLYFTAGPHDEAHGLFGSLKPTPSKVHPPFEVVGADEGGGPHVKVFDADDNTLFSFFAFDPSFRGGVRVAVGDFNGDGTPDIVVAAGTGGGPHVKVFSGADGSLLESFFAFDPSFRGGVTVAVGDVNGDGFADIIVGADNGGGPHVRVFSGADGSVLASFFAFDVNFRGGIRVAAGDLNGDGLADIIVSAGIGGGPHVKEFDSLTGNLIGSFFAIDSGFRGGLFVAAGDINGDGLADLIVGIGTGGVGRVLVFLGTSTTASQNFLAFEGTFTGGVRVAARDLDDDGDDDLIIGAGHGHQPGFHVHNSATTHDNGDHDAFDQSFDGGVFVG